MSEKREKSTIVTIAKEIGVSPSTVSRSFDPNSRISTEMRQRILECAKRQNYIPNRAASRLPMKSIRIGLLVNDFYEPATTGFHRGVNAAYQELHDLKIQFESCVLNYRTKTIDMLERALERFRGFDGLIVSGFTDLPEIQALNRYFRAHHNLVLIQADVPGIERLSVSKHDSSVAGRLAAEYLGDCLRMAPSRDVVLFTGDRNWETHSIAAETFPIAAKENGLNLIATYNMRDSEELLTRQLKMLYEDEGKRPRGIYITSGKSLALCEYIKSHRLCDTTALVTSDVSNEIGEYMKEGVVWATIYQDFYNQAYHAFVRLVHHTLGEQEIDKLLLHAPALVLGSKLDYYLKN